MHGYFLGSGTEFNVARVERIHTNQVFSPLAMSLAF